MKNLLIFTLLIVLLSCSDKESEYSIIGKWQETTEGGRFTFTFNADGTGSVEEVDFITHANPASNIPFDYTVNYETHLLTIEWKVKTAWDNRNDVFAVIDGKILKFWDFELRKL